MIDDFEIVNEPDGRWAFLGSPQQYAVMLAESYDAIHAANPHARVALGGLMDTRSAGSAWTQSMFATPGVDARHKFDIANIHLRTRASRAGIAVARWARYFHRRGFRGPLWVTETGYPADTAQQADPAYRGGAAGAAKVFVTERDSQPGPFASEGVLRSSDPLTAWPSYSRPPSFYAVRRLATTLARRIPRHVR